MLDPYGISYFPSNDEDDPDFIKAKRVLLNCPWYRVYDLIEDIYIQCAFHEDNFDFEDDDEFSVKTSRLVSELNKYFEYAGIGWQLIQGQILPRGDQGFQEAVETAASHLVESNRPTAAGHIKSAIRALAERPKPNTSGAASHATNSVECVLHDITGQAMPLGKYLDKHPTLFHPSLKKALDGVFGYASDAGARHGKEGKEPTFAEAQFVVTICAAACSLLTARNPKDKV